MKNTFFEIPMPVNEPVKEYKPGSSEKTELKKELSNLKNKAKRGIESVKTIELPKPNP